MAKAPEWIIMTSRFPFREVPCIHNPMLFRPHVFSSIVHCILQSKVPRYAFHICIYGSAIEVFVCRDGLECGSYASAILNLLSKAYREIWIYVYGRPCKE